MTYNPFKENNPTSNSIFGNNATSSNNLFGANNNNNKTSTLFGNTSNTTTFAFGANSNTNTTPIFQNNNNNTTTSNAPLFGNNQNSSNNQNVLFGANNTNNNQNTTNNTQNNLFGANNTTNNLNSGNNLFCVNNNNNNTTTTSTSLFNQNIMNIQNQNNNNLFNLSGINNDNNQNNNNILNNNNNQQNNNILQNQLLNVNNPRIQHDLLEYYQVLFNVEKCSKPSEIENMFKDYLYLPIPKGKSPNEMNVYRPYTVVNNTEKIVNDYNIWDEGNKKNKNPNEFFTVQISSVEALLDRNKHLEKAILMTIAKTVEGEKNLEVLNKKIEDEMNNKLLEVKNIHLKLNELELSLSSKVAQYNYLVGSAKENVADTQEIKENIKKSNENIKQNNMLELCEKIKKSSNENFGGENKNYIKDMSKERINNMLDNLTEIQNMMTVIYNNNKKNLNLITGMQIEADKILKKNDL
jgi:hypothetical protein